MKKILALVCSAALVLSVTGCASSKDTQQPSTAPPATEPDTQSTVESVYGQVTAVDGSKITVLLGAYTQGEMPPGAPADGNGQPPEMSGGQEGAPGDGQTPPEGQGGAPEDGQTPPEGQDGAPEDGQTPPDRPDGDGGMEQPGGQGGPGGGFGGFQAGTETKVFDISSADIFVENGPDMTAGTLEDITVDAIVELVVEGDTVTGVVIKSAMGGGMGDPGGGGFVPDEAGDNVTSEAGDSDTADASEQAS